MLPEAEVQTLFNALLDRQPEPKALGHFTRFKSLLDVVSAITSSPEYVSRLRHSPFDQCHSVVDATALVRSFEDKDRQAQPGHRVNYFGVAIPDGVIPGHVLKDVPEVEADPLPANWHADKAEFAAVLRAVDLAKGRFTMAELGCGWGCWMNISGKCAKQRNLPVRLIGIEGDRHNLGLARQTLAFNGFAESEYVLHHGIAYAHSGKAAFPQQVPGSDQWGLKPLFISDGENGEIPANYEVLPMIGMPRLFADVPRVDLVHIDIQGDEANLVAGAIAELSKKVAYLVIGTHSREIEGQLFAILGEAGWRLEVERPAFLMLEAPEGPRVAVDGVQGWRNPRLFS